MPKEILVLVAAFLIASAWAVYGGGQPIKDLGHVIEWLGMVAAGSGLGCLFHLAFSWHTAGLCLLVIAVSSLIALAGHQLIKLAERREASKGLLQPDKAVQ